MMSKQNNGMSENVTYGGVLWRIIDSHMKSDGRNNSSVLRKNNCHYNVGINVQGPFNNHISTHTILELTVLSQFITLF